MNGDLFEKLRCVKQRLVFEFEEYILSKLIYFSNNVDDMNVTIITNELNDFVKKITLYVQIFYF